MAHRWALFFFLSRCCCRSFLFLVGMCRLIVRLLLLDPRARPHLPLLHRSHLVTLPPFPLLSRHFIHRRRLKVPASLAYSLFGRLVLSVLVIGRSHIASYQPSRPCLFRGNEKRSYYPNSLVLTEARTNSPPFPVSPSYPTTRHGASARSRVAAVAPRTKRSRPDRASRQERASGQYHRPPITTRPGHNTPIRRPCHAMTITDRIDDN